MATQVDHLENAIRQLELRKDRLKRRYDSRMSEIDNSIDGVRHALEMLRSPDEDDEAAAPKKAIMAVADQPYHKGTKEWLERYIERMEPGEWHGVAAIIEAARNAGVRLGQPNSARSYISRLLAAFEKAGKLVHEHGHGYARPDPKFGTPMIEEMAKAERRKSHG